ncbi:verprolin [Coemansia sp. RSA 988]|nr:verprolin [Coemansia sp. RSA 988]
MADRNALLKQIQKGRKLNKTVTNDRSTPHVGGSTGGGGGRPPMAAMGLPRPPMVPSTGASGAAGKSVPADLQAAPTPMPGFGNLLSMERPKLKHRAGGIDVGRTSEDNDFPTTKNTAAEPSEQNSAGQKIANGLRFSLPFRRNSRSRGESHPSNGSESFGSKPREPPSPRPLSPGRNGSPAVPERRPDSARNWTPPALPTSASRPASSVSAKRAPPRPPLSSKPQIKPKPAGLVAGRMSSAHSPPAAGSGGSPSLRGQIRLVSSPTQDPPRTSSRTSADDRDDSGGIIAESQGSVSSLAGMFGQSIKNRNVGHGRTLTGGTFTGPASMSRVPARAPPPPPSTTGGGGASHRRTNSAAAPSHLPPPPPKPPLSSPPADKGIPVREGKWTFHSLSDLPPPPPAGKIARHAYPSGNFTGSTINLDA